MNGNYELFIIRSKPFAVEEVGRTYIKVNKIAESTDELIRADIILEGATFYVTFQKVTGRWPYRIENESNESIAIWQKSSRPRTYLIRKNETINYAWDDTSSTKKLLVLNICGEERSIDLLKIGTRDPMLCKKLQTGPAYFGIQVVADGPVIILRVTTLGSENIENKNHGSFETSSSSKSAEQRASADAMLTVSKWI